MRRWQRTCCFLVNVLIFVHMVPNSLCQNVKAQNQVKFKATRVLQCFFPWLHLPTSDSFFMKPMPQECILPIILSLCTLLMTHGQKVCFFQDTTQPEVLVSIHEFVVVVVNRFKSGGKKKKERKKHLKIKQSSWPFESHKPGCKTWFRHLRLWAKCWGSLK